jgi:CheY-like chemotaxis protein
VNDKYTKGSIFANGSFVGYAAATVALPLALAFHEPPAQLTHSLPVHEERAVPYPQAIYPNRSQEAIVDFVTLGVGPLVNAGRRYRLLVVDDESGVRALLDRVLVGAGYDTIVAGDGPEALRLLLTAQPIDLLVTDFQMPAMNGYELARRVRQLQPDVRVLYVTGFADGLFSEQPVLGPGDAFVEKPISPIGLREAVSLAIFGHMRGLA